MWESWPAPVGSVRGDPERSDPDRRRLDVGSQRKAEEDGARVLVADDGDPCDRSRSLGDHVDPAADLQVAMARGCETQARALSRRARLLRRRDSTTNPRSTSPAKAKTKGATHARSCAAPRSPLGGHPGRLLRIRQSRPPLDGPHLARRAGSLVALSLVSAIAVWGARR